MFGVKDPIPCGLYMCVVYKFLCVGCQQGFAMSAKPPRI